MRRALPSRLFRRDRAAPPAGVRSEARVYFSERAVRFYEGRTELFDGERPVAAELREHPARRLLDVGVGAGRTTPHVAPHAGAYVGVDLSPGMVDVCRRRFPHLRFEVADVRDLSGFGDGSFDAVLFSHNGLDTVGGDAERHAALVELRRVCAPGGRFFFSSKNLNQAPLQASLRLQLRQAFVDADGPRLPLRVGKALARTARARLLNPSPARLRELGHAMIVDDRDGLRPLRHYYVRPDEMVRRLRELGFDEIRAFDHDGAPVEPERLAAVGGDSVYYRCRRAP